MPAYLDTESDDIYVINKFDYLIQDCKNKVCD